ncbi:carboxylesterase family protein [Sphingopyxis sp. CCNWLW253]|uniref:carboxylesterase/lipase family protein n=1 Tax=unclassified Sphingopyxis TaxID=2614943 RepID=UPI003012E546
MLRSVLPLVAIALAFPGSAAAHSGQPEVKIASGRVAGTSDGDVVSFKGLPYAAPPVGDLRWRAPKKAERWSGTRKADTYGAICQQIHQPKDNGVGPLPMSEDCLTLNVFAPVAAKKAPVMVWIHGGGYVNGSGTAALYDGSALAREGVVVVTLNYRLGRFGFFAHPALTADADGEAVGNYGLMDMIAALKWVRDNAARFGGDPRQVTIFGESAGGAAVNALMTSPAARGLFVRGIVQSGLGRETVLSLAEAESAGDAFAANVGARDATADTLRGLSAEAILKGGDPQIFTGGGPMVDGTILTRAPIDSFRRGEQARIPYVIGWNSLEFPVPAAALSSANPLSSAIPTGLLARAEPAYPDKDSYSLNFLSDMLFVEPAIALARLHARQGNPTFVYQFSIVPKAAQSMLKGAVHASDREYVFQTLGASNWPTDANDAAQARTISSYWAGFATTGNPNGGARPPWPRFDPAQARLIDFTGAGPMAADIPRAAAIEMIATAHDAPGEPVTAVGEKQD